MGASCCIRGVRDLNGKFEDLYKILRACVDGGVTVPREVSEYFSQVEDEGYELETLSKKDIQKYMQEVEITVTGEIEYHGGAEIDLAKVPSDVKFIRIYMEA